MTPDELRAAADRMETHASILSNTYPYSLPTQSDVLLSAESMRRLADVIEYAERELEDPWGGWIPPGTLLAIARGESDEEEKP